MVNESKFYKDDAGIVISCDCVTDITGATSITVEYKKPDDTTGSWSATLTGTYDPDPDVSTQRIEYTTQPGDIDQEGVWHFQPKFTLGGWTGRGETASIRIYDSFD